MKFQPWQIEEVTNRIEKNKRLYILQLFKANNTLEKIKYDESILFEYNRKKPFDEHL